MGLSTAPLGSRVRSMQRIGLTLVVLIGAINYLDRVALSFAVPLIRKDLNLSLGQIGLLISAFFWSYALSQLPMAPSSTAPARASCSPSALSSGRSPRA